MVTALVMVCFVLTAFLVIRSIQELVHRRKGNGTVQLPFGIAVLGMVCSGVFCALLLFFREKGIVPCVIFAAFVLLGDCLIMGYVNCVILYDSSGFQARNFFGIVRTCRYADVTGVRSGRDHWVYFCGNKILVDQISHGGTAFLKTLRKSYTAQTGNILPESVGFGRKMDPMNGHIEYPWFYFFLWVLLAVMCLGMMGMMIYSVTVETDPAKLVAHKVVFTEYETDDEDLLLYAPGYENPFRIGYYEDYEDERITPKALCDGESYLAYTQRETGGSIDRLFNSNGEELISPEQEREIYRKNQVAGVWLMAILSIFGFVFSIMGIFVTRNPDRYPQWVCKLYYKEGYLR